jgi:hypothetical protein
MPANIYLFVTECIEFPLNLADTFLEKVLCPEYKLTVLTRRLGNTHNF